MPTDDSLTALRALLESEIRAVDMRFTERLTLINETGLAVVHTADDGIRRELTAKIEAVARELLLIQTAAAIAVDKAERSTEKRFESVNEFRAQLSDQTKNFASREQVEDMRERIEKLASKEAVETAAGARGTRFEQGEARLKELEGFKNNMQGRMWAIPAVIGLIVFILTQAMRVLFPSVTR